MRSGVEGARRSLEGLSIGDAFGELFFHTIPMPHQTSELPGGAWRWTDDTHEALSVIEVLREHGRIDAQPLAAALSRRYLEQPHRGYSLGAARLLARIGTGFDWRIESVQAFPGGSFGNGSAMRAAPIGGWFAGDPGRAAEQARLSALPTHPHPEGQAGAIAVAVAAAIAASPSPPRGEAFIREVLAATPVGEVQSRIRRVAGFAPTDVVGAVLAVGSGSECTCQDTVPYCVWMAAHHLDDYEAALWETVLGLGDMDTTCAIVGGIVALSAPTIPEAWRGAREPLPAEFR